MPSGRYGLRVWLFANRRASLCNPQEPGRDQASPTATQEKGANWKDRKLHNPAIRRVRAGLHYASHCGGQRRTGSGDVSVAMASRVDIQTLEVHRADRTRSETRRPKQPILAVWQAVCSLAEPEAGKSGQDDVPLGLPPAGSYPLPVRGVNSSSPFTKCSPPSLPLSRYKLSCNAGIRWLQP